jgi:excisionase family DNA binding protein
MTNQKNTLTLSIPEAAEKIGISAPTLRLAIKNKQVPCLILAKNKWRIPVAALDKYLANAGDDT